MKSLAIVKTGLNIGEGMKDVHDELSEDMNMTSGWIAMRCIKARHFWDEKM